MATVSMYRTPLRINAHYDPKRTAERLMPETHREHEKRPEQSAAPDAVNVAKNHDYNHLSRVAGAVQGRGAQVSWYIGLLAAGW